MPNRYPQDIGFTIMSPSGTVFVDEQTGSFSSSTATSLYNKTYSLPMSESYVLTVTDSKGDGRKSLNDVSQQPPPACFNNLHPHVFLFLKVCCAYGDGYIVVYLEEISHERMLLLLEGDFHYQQQGTFLSSIDGIVADVIPAIPTSRPTTSPSVGVPSASPFPTAADAMLSIVVVTDLYPGKFHYCERKPPNLSKGAK